MCAVQSLSPLMATVSKSTRPSIRLEGLSRQRDYALTRTTLRRWKADIGSTVTKCLDEALI